MPRIAIIKDGKVFNITEDTLANASQYHPQVAQINQPGVAIGWLYDGTTFTEPAIAPKVPREVTMRQARLALHAAGLLTNVTSAINGLPEPTKTQAGIEWEYSNALQRNNPLVTTLGGLLGLTEQQIDNLFIAAEKI